jgi:hypothetical protein
MILIFGDTDEPILAEDNYSSVVFGRILILFEHQVRILVFDLLKRQEDLSFLLNLSKQVSDLLGGLWLLLLDVSVSQEGDLGGLRFWNNRCLSLLLELTCSWPTRHYGLSELIASGSSGHL